MAAFISKQKILFQHCDPARIVFFPRYFEILNAVVEEWFELGIGVSFKEMHIGREEGIPTAHIEATFMVSSQLGDVLDFSIQVARIGNSSARLVVEAHCEGELRLKMRQIIVHISNEDGKSRAWPDDMRKPMMRYLVNLNEDGKQANA